MTTHTAASANLADVQAKINVAANGDTVQIPAGTARWNTGLNVGKSLTIIGAGPGVTILQGPIPDTTYFFDVANSGSVRISGLTIDAKGVGGGIRITSGNSYHRVDHCNFKDTGNSSGFSNYGRGVQFRGFKCYGLIDHCAFTNDTTHFEILGSDSNSWLPNEPIGLGTKDAVYIEDCTFNATPGRITGVNSGIYNSNGAKTVFRHNKVNYTDPNAGSFWDSHGNNNLLPSNSRGTVFTLIEDCDIYINHPNYGAKVFYIRGGIFIAARNKMDTVGTTYLWCLTEEECWYASSGSGNFGPVDHSSYPRQDQITNSWLYGNTLNGVSYNTVLLTDNGVGHKYVAGVIQNNRDYKEGVVPPAYNPTQNFAASGPSYGYTPFQYPHPAASGGPIIPPIEPPVPVEPPLMTGLSFQAEAGAVDTPYVIAGGLVSQNIVTTDPSQGGRARYKVMIVTAGTYQVKVKIDAVDSGADSLFMAFDTEPTTADQWTVTPFTVGVEERTNPKKWTLTAGEHVLFVRGREGQCKLDAITIFTETTEPPIPPVPDKITIADVEGLQAALDAKADKSHQHTIPESQTT